MNVNRLFEIDFYTYDDYPSLTMKIVENLVCFILKVKSLLNLVIKFLCSFILYYIWGKLKEVLFVPNKQKEKIMQNFCKKHVRMRKIWYNNSNQLEMR